MENQLKKKTWETPSILMLTISQDTSGKVFNCAEVTSVSGAEFFFCGGSTPS